MDDTSSSRRENATASVNEWRYVEVKSFDKFCLRIDPACLAVPRAAESTAAALSDGEFLDDVEFDLHDGNDHHLRDAITGLNGE
jgi:hypothetical protein